ncbi:hypothetical protein NPIL_363601 [Nephila pilipes]|uniref:Uncharacterized protein n=1 Tax=Nephila pilipes TaxID=299642 RepID=A0A8X6MS13_NEPPI|nr:hypothetical protein NPIL_363601 [Nephila pilipes]
MMMIVRVLGFFSANSTGLCFSPQGGACQTACTFVERKSLADEAGDMVSAAHLCSLLQTYSTQVRCVEKERTCKCNNRGHPFYAIDTHKVINTAESAGNTPTSEFSLFKGCDPELSFCNLCSRGKSGTPDSLARTWTAAQGVTWLFGKEAHSPNRVIFTNRERTPLPWATVHVAARSFRGSRWGPLAVNS